MRAIPVLCAAVVTLGLLATPAQAATITAVASADTNVNSNAPTTAYGTLPIARVNHGNVEKLAYFKFTVAGIPAGDAVSTATLGLTTSADAQAADTLDVYSVGNTWTESTTYNTRPALGALVGHVSVTGPNQAVSLPVPVAGNGTFSFAVWKTTAGNGDSVFATRQATTTAARPKLTVDSAPPAPAPAPAPAPIAAPPTFPACPTNVVTPFPSGTTLTSQYKVGTPGNSTYNLTGVTSTAYPATSSPFAFGTTTPPANFCMTNGNIAGTTNDSLGWSYYHDTYNASCVRIVATSMVQVNGLRCHDIEDGLKVLENNSSVGNSNTTTLYSSGVYLNRVRDDCIENDYTLGGVLYDSLWDGCNTGVSERPASSNGTWTSPAGETLTLDHMLIGLWETWHEADNKSGENALFKWSSSANKLVIKCSTFKVDSVSLNGASSNDIPAGTVVDDSGCPNNPTTIVWLGGGSYPGNLNGTGIRITSDASVWTNAVAAWHAAHP